MHAVIVEESIEVYVTVGGSMPVFFVPGCAPTFIIDQLVGDHYLTVWQP